MNWTLYRFVGGIPEYVTRLDSTLNGRTDHEVDWARGQNINGWLTLIDASKFVVRYHQNTDEYLIYIHEDLLEGVA